jgi:protein-tyrosine phosphatase
VPTPELRPLLARDGIFNVRDLGGLPARDGRRVRPRRLVRGDALQRSRAATATALHDHGVRVVLDLRDDSERHEEGSFDAPHLTDPGIAVHHTPVLDPTYRWGGPDLAPEELLPRRYGEILESFHRRLALAVERVVETLAGDDAAAVAYHCAIGKDRTGLLTMLLLGAVGVSDDVIVSDYARSARSTAVQVAWMRSHGHRYGDVGDDDLAVGLWSARPETMAATLTLLSERFGGARAYLRDAGLGDDALDALAAALLEPAGSGPARGGHDGPGTE